MPLLKHRVERKRNCDRQLTPGYDDVLNLLFSAPLSVIARPTRCPGIFLWVCHKVLVPFIFSLALYSIILNVISSHSSVLFRTRFAR